MIIKLAKFGELFSFGGNSKGQCACSSKAKNVSAWNPCLFDIGEIMEDNLNTRVSKSNVSYEIKNKKERRKDKRKEERLNPDKNRKKKKEKCEQVVVKTFCVNEFACGRNHSVLICNDWKKIMISGEYDCGKGKTIKSSWFIPFKELSLKPGQEKFTHLETFENTILTVIDKRFIVLNCEGRIQEFDVLQRFGYSEISEIALGSMDSFAFTTKNGRIFIYSGSAWIETLNSPNYVFYDLISASCFKIKNLKDGTAKSYYSHGYSTDLSQFKESTFEILPSYLSYFEIDKQNNKIYCCGANQNNQLGLKEPKYNSSTVHEYLSELLERFNFIDVKYGHGFSLVSMAKKNSSKKKKLNDNFKNLLNDRSSFFIDLTIETAS
ncbi:predicted protein [Naegleria gruberi]|uniref:Predicted protein n=1 Tax=Naegleria gruberi TaxID=5762 RepID=D2VUQ7_NAEGR|nr:uncharacterized protein NAEGRDRAFT_72749 [Naegleria gruberi]EFC39550.1 predicted protein [Naegleria gruberi]|eukprot:XP_002672294.1 predicted protein [Naegleria gruberi strain NEG-M]